MGEVLMQALKLTIVGMGMTFGSIGALIGGMYLLTGLAMDRPQGAAMKRYSPTKPARTETPGRDVAAVAAVSAALAEEKDARDPKHIAAVAAVTAALASVTADTAAPGAPPQPLMDVWTLQARSQQLARRAHYNALHARRSDL
jgi:Na+-transporting methylmalonyl-CoA/oxaloacetate decarboxylase gamma subunit